MCPMLRIPAAPSCHLARWCLGAAASDSWRRRPGSVCPGVQYTCRYTASALPSVCLSLGHLSDPQAGFLGWLLCSCNSFININVNKLSIINIFFWHRVAYLASLFFLQANVSLLNSYKSSRNSWSLCVVTKEDSTFPNLPKYERSFLFVFCLPASK